MKRCVCTCVFSERYVCVHSEGVCVLSERWVCVLSEGVCVT